MGDLLDDYLGKCSKMGMRLDDKNPYQLQSIIHAKIDSLGIPADTKVFLKELFDTLVMNVWYLVQLDIQGR
jgi:hypothetical protein